MERGKCSHWSRKRLTRMRLTTSEQNAPPGMVDEPIVRKKKKEKVLFDGRTKAYEQHREKLEGLKEKKSKVA